MWTHSCQLTIHIRHFARRKTPLHRQLWLVAICWSRWNADEGYYIEHGMEKPIFMWRNSNKKDIAIRMWYGFWSGRNKHTEALKWWKLQLWAILSNGWKNGTHVERSWWTQARQSWIQSHRHRINFGRKTKSWWRQTRMSEIKENARNSGKDTHKSASNE